jgi:peptidoglycan hydrolase-like protein with peptidoglycan-binding domain
VEFTLHYATGSTSQTPRQIQGFHMNSRGWSDIGYNFLVDSEGRIYEGRGWTVLGAHAAPRNVQGLGVCYIGDDGMTDAAKRSVVDLYDEACRRAGRTLTRKGHRDINSTSCPGTKNHAWWKSKNYRNVAAGGGSPAPSPTEPVYRREDRDGMLEPFEYGAAIGALQRKLGIKDDEYFGPVTEKAVRAYQKQHGLDVDGIAGPATLAHMGLAEAAPDTKPTPKPTPKPGDGRLAEDGQLGPVTAKRVQRELGVTQDGVWARLTVRALQRRVGAGDDGLLGPKTTKKVQARVGAKVDGIWPSIARVYNSGLVELNSSARSETTEKIQAAINRGEF